MSTPDPNVTTSRNDSCRTGAYLAETMLRPANVNGARFGRLYERHVNGDLLAQILYVRGVRGTPRGTKNLFFAATSTNEVYAFDADDANNANPVWKTAPLGPTRLLNEGEICRETIGTVGITSTPVIDVAHQTMYVIARHWAHGGAPVPGRIDLCGDNYLHALKLSDGTPRVPAVKIAGTDPRTNMTFDPRVQRNRPGLLLVDDVVYAAFGTFSCDAGHYHGWVFGYAADNLAPRGRSSAPQASPRPTGAQASGSPVTVSLAAMVTSTSRPATTSTNLILGRVLNQASQTKAQAR